MTGGHTKAGRPTETVLWPLGMQGRGRDTAVLGAGTYPRAARCLHLGSTSPRGRAGRLQETVRLPAGSGLPPGREGQRASLMGSSDLQGSRSDSTERWDPLPPTPHTSQHCGSPKGSEGAAGGV